MGDITYEELMAAEADTRAHSLNETALAGELRTGRFAAADEPPEPVGWDDRVRSRRLRHEGL